MARPRIFISSTYYDLKHLRSTLESFVQRLGFEPILSEKGDIAYSPDQPLDESCYREARNADIFVLIVGGRYGSERSPKSDKGAQQFYERYDSITKEELRSALAADVPVYVLVERAVYSEYVTYTKNRSKADVTYAHVDSVNIFELLDEVLRLPRNNPVHTFDTPEEIEEWLREQWAGLFRELLRRVAQNKQLSSLSAQVQTLTEVNTTLKRYLEAVVTKVAPDTSVNLIDEESKRLRDAEFEAQLAQNPFVAWVNMRASDVPMSLIRSALTEAPDVKTFAARVSTEKLSEGEIVELLASIPEALADLNRARTLVGRPEWEAPKGRRARHR